MISLSRVIVIVLIACLMVAIFYFTQTSNKNNDMIITGGTSTGFQAPNLQHEKGRGPRYLTLEELTGNPPEGSINCTSPLLPAYDRIVSNTDDYLPRKIPRAIHVSMKSRCLSPDLYENMEKWKKALPYHSYYFHDDAAVDRLLDMPWEEFPQLKSMMRCVRFKGAMKIDVWRILVIYGYGGLYCDSDMYPKEGFTESSPISADDQAFFASDAWNRPSQWFFAMQPGHPTAYITVFEILHRLQKLDLIERPKVVFVTGPDALKHGYGLSTGWATDVRGGIYAEGTHTCLKKYGNWTVTKRSEGNGHVRSNDMKEIVAWNATLNVTRRQKNEWQHGVVHWLSQRNSKKVEFKGSCMEYLYSLDMAS